MGEICWSRATTRVFRPASFWSRFSSDGGEQALLGDDLEERASRREKIRFARADDDDIEESPPAHALGQEAIQDIAHHRFSVEPLRIGDQHQLLAGMMLVKQSEGSGRIEI